MIFKASPDEVEDERKNIDLMKDYEQFYTTFFVHACDMLGLNTERLLAESRAGVRHGASGIVRRRDKVVEAAWLWEDIDLPDTMMLHLIMPDTLRHVPPAEVVLHTEVAARQAEHFLIWLPPNRIGLKRLLIKAGLLPTGRRPREHPDCEEWLLTARQLLELGHYVAGRLTATRLRHEKHGSNDE